MRRANEANREKFIKAAASELEEHGVSDFSIRRVARRCHLSCAAPYKHFNGREELILEVMRYIKTRWTMILNDTLATYENEAIREKIVAVCMAYLTFLCTYPEYQTILFMNDRSFSPEMRAEKAEISARARNLIHDFTSEIRMPEDVRNRKLFVIRSIIFGAAIMINSGQMAFDSQTIQMVRVHIERELDLE